MSSSSNSTPGVMLYYDLRPAIAYLSREEKGELLPACRAHGVRLISMIAPTSEERISMIASEAEGFLYVVSSMGVTGVRQRFSNNLRDMVASVKAVSDVPCAVGFGVSTPEQAAEIASFADGVIVGSAIVDIIAEHGRDSAQHVAEYVRSMRAGIDACGRVSGGCPAPEAVPVR